MGASPASEVSGGGGSGGIGGAGNTRGASSGTLGAATGSTTRGKMYNRRTWTKEENEQLQEGMAALGGPTAEFGRNVSVTCLYPLGLDVSVPEKTTVKVPDVSFVSPIVKTTVHSLALYNSIIVLIVRVPCTSC